MLPETIPNDVVTEMKKIILGARETINIQIYLRCLNCMVSVSKKWWNPEECYLCDVTRCTNQTEENPQGFSFAYHAMQAAITCLLLLRKQNQIRDVRQVIITKLLMSSNEVWMNLCKSVAKFKERKTKTVRVRNDRPAEPAEECNLL